MNVITKRFVDIFLSLGGLIVFSPVMLVLSLLVKLSSPGPICFRQKRVGRFGKPFLMLKFRTMIDRSDSCGPKITVEGDARITPFGAMLRRYKLDELPQLLNVLKGEMSFVGPRPEVQEYVALYPEAMKEKILSVRPGITSLATVKYRDEGFLLAEAKDPESSYIHEVIPDKLRYDVCYVGKNNLWMDLKIIMMTIAAVFRSAQDRMEGKIVFSKKIQHETR